MSRKKHSDYDKEEAVAAWVATGTYAGASRATGISQGTIRAWHDRQTSWWDEVAGKVREQNEERHRANLTKIMDRCSEEIMERLENGDEHRNAKGETYRLKVKAQVIAVILGITSEKRSLSLGLPTAISGKHIAESTKDRLQELKRVAIKSGAVVELDSAGAANNG